MHSEANFYLCRNLVYLDESEFHGYLCSVTGKRCRCEANTLDCFVFEQEEEE